MKKLMLLSLAMVVILGFTTPNISAAKCPYPWILENCEYAYGYHFYDVDIACDNAFDAAEEACEPPPENCFCVYYYMGHGPVWMGSLKVMQCTVRYCDCCFYGK